MRRRITGIVAAFALATAGTLLLVVYVQSARNEAVAGERLVRVLVVKDRIEKGTKAPDIEDAVGVERVPAKVRADGAVGAVADLGDDLVAGVDLLPGEQVVTSRFVTEAQAARGDVPEGLQEVTVGLEPPRALGGRLSAGDTVGVFLSFDPFDINREGDKTPNSTHLELHKVLVTNVQIDTSGGAPVGDDDADSESAAPTGNVLVTLAVDAPGAERVVFAAEHGFVWLSAEPEAADEGGTDIITRGNVYTEVAP